MATDRVRQRTTSDWKVDPEQQLNGSASARSPDAIVVKRKAIWKTRQIALDQNDSVSYVNLTIQEMVVHAVFLVFFTAFCSDLYTHETFMFNREIWTLLIDSKYPVDEYDDDVTFKFQTTITMELFWKFSQKIMCEKVFDTMEMAGSRSDNGLSRILDGTKLLFRPKARQVRVKEGECKIRTQFQGLFHDCYAPYELEYEDKSSFGPKKGTAWIYSDASVTEGAAYTSEIASYGAGGYYFYFPKDKKAAQAVFTDLEYNTWLDRGTRAVFLDFSFYNSDINVICLGKLLFEFPVWGGLMPSYSIETIKLHQWRSVQEFTDWLTSAGMFMVVLFIFYFTIEEIFEILYFRLNYFKIFWNYIDFGIVVIGWCISGMTATTAIRESVLNLSETSNFDYRFIDALAFSHKTMDQLSTIMCCLICIKIIKYMDLNKTMTIVYFSIEWCFKIIVKYLCALSIAVFAFAMFGYSVFGQQVKEFSSVYETIRSTLGLLTGDFQSLRLPGGTTFILICSFAFMGAAIIVLFFMLLSISLHAYFAMHAEELLLIHRKLYVCDRVSAFVEGLSKLVGLKNWANRRQNDRLNRMLLVDKEILEFEEEWQRSIPNTSREYGAQTDTEYSTEINGVVEELNELESSMENIHKKCDLVRVRLSEIRGMFQSDYAEDHQRTNDVQ